MLLTNVTWLYEFTLSFIVYNSTNTITLGEIYAVYLFMFKANGISGTEISKNIFQYPFEALLNSFFGEKNITATKSYGYIKYFKIGFIANSFQELGRFLVDTGQLNESTAKRATYLYNCALEELAALIPHNDPILVKLFPNGFPTKTEINSIIREYESTNGQNGVIQTPSLDIKYNPVDVGRKITEKEKRKDQEEKEGPFSVKDYDARMERLKKQIPGLDEFLKSGKKLDEGKLKDQIKNFDSTYENIAKSNFSEPDLDKLNKAKTGLSSLTLIADELDSKEGQRLEKEVLRNTIRDTIETIQDLQQQILDRQSKDEEQKGS